MLVETRSQIKTYYWTAYFSGIDKKLFEDYTVNHTHEFIDLEGVHI